MKLLQSSTGQYILWPVIYKCKVQITFSAILHFIINVKNDRYVVNAKQDQNSSLYSQSIQYSNSSTGQGTYLQMLWEVEGGRWQYPWDVSGAPRRYKESIFPLTCFTNVPQKGPKLVLVIANWEKNCWNTKLPRRRWQCIISIKHKRRNRVNKMNFK